MDTKKICKVLFSDYKQDKITSFEFQYVLACLNVSHIALDNIVYPVFLLSPSILSVYKNLTDIEMKE